MARKSSGKAKTASGTKKKQTARKPSAESFLRKARILSMRNTLAANAEAVRVLSSAALLGGSERVRARGGYQKIKQWLHDTRAPNSLRDEGFRESQVAYFQSHKDWYTNWAFAIACRYLKDFNEAERRYEEALRLIKPNDPDADEFFAEYAEYLVYRGDPGGAVAWTGVKLGAGVHGSTAPGWFLWIRAWAHHQAGSHELSLQDLEWLENRNRLDPDALLVRAASLIGLGRRIEAQGVMSAFRASGDERDQWSQALERTRGTFWPSAGAQEAEWIEHLRDAGLPA
jgi:tetratricopeptide (TPR) repeat protein